MQNLTSIIRVSGNFDDFKTNLEIRACLYNKFYKKDTSFLLVDYGDDINESVKFEEFSQANNWDYIKCPPGSNNSKAINLGIINSSTEFIILEDIDLIHPIRFYERIQTEIINDWDSRPFNFYSVPVAYLSEEESEAIAINPSLLSEEFLHKIKDDLELNHPYKYLQHFASQSSLIVLRKTTAQFVGLFDEAFEGWGGEDRDFIFRLISSNTKIIHNNDFGYTSTENGDRISKYVGWKSIWTLHGDYLYNKDLISFHLYHEERNWKKKGARGNNRSTIKYAAQKAKLIGSNYFKYLQPKPNKDCNIFIFGRNPHIFNQDLFDAIGGFNVLEENWDIPEILKIIKQDSKIIFWNPWGSSRRLLIYKTLKSNGYKTWVAERGALPNSIVFDKDGLVIFSNSYRRENWEKTLTKKEFDITEEYLTSIKNSNSTLETQGDINNIDILKLKLEANKFYKIVLVCLQLSSDTVTNQVVDGYCSYSEFINEIKKLERIIPADWLLLIKNHPLSKIKFSCEKAKCVDDVHIHTLLKLVDTVIVYNSGTGVIARIFEKPVITFGPNSYSDNRFTVRANSAEDCFEIIKNKLPVLDHNLVVKYFSYLINKLYSFANFYDSKVRETAVARLVYPSKVGYYIVNNPFTDNTKRYCCERFDPYSSLLFKRFFNFNTKQNSNVISGKFSKPEPLNKKVAQDSKTIRRSRLIKKLFNDPYGYFRDSKYPIRWIRFLFPRKK